MPSFHPDWSNWNLRMWNKAWKFWNLPLGFPGDGHIWRCVQNFPDFKVCWNWSSGSVDWSLLPPKVRKRNTGCCVVMNHLTKEDKSGWASKGIWDLMQKCGKSILDWEVAQSEPCARWRWRDQETVAGPAQIKWSDTPNLALGSELPIVLDADVFFPLQDPGVQRWGFQFCLLNMMLSPWQCFRTWLLLWLLLSSLLRPYIPATS